MQTAAPFKIWTPAGTAARVHRTAVLNRASVAYGRSGYERAAALIGSGEYVSALLANDALMAAQ